MKGIQVVVRLNDGGTLSLATNGSGYILGRVRPTKPVPSTHTMKISEAEMLDLPTLIQKIGTIL